MIQLSQINPEDFHADCTGVVQKALTKSPREDSARGWIHYLRSTEYSLLALALYCFVPLPSLDGQELTPRAGHSKAGFASAENRWRLQGTALDSKEDWVPPEVREKRNLYWQRDFKDYVFPNQNVPDFAEPILPDIEFLAIPGGSYVVMTFVDYRVIAVDQDQQLLYTERHFRIDDVLDQPETSHLKVGDFIDSDVGGGARLSKDGKYYAFRISPKRFALQPGKQYIALVKPVSSGLFYDVVKFWLIQNGRVVADNDQEEIRSQLNKSKIVDLPLETAKEEAQRGIKIEKSRLTSPIK